MSDDDEITLDERIEKEGGVWGILNYGIDPSDIKDKRQRAIYRRIYNTYWKLQELVYDAEDNPLDESADSILEGPGTITDEYTGDNAKIKDLLENLRKAVDEFGYDWMD